MQLSDKSGIGCDNCGTTHRHDFVYYSFDFHYVEVTSNRRPALDSIVESRVISSLDICVACYDKLTTKVIENYSKASKLAAVTVCELSGVVMTGTYNYYYIVVARVDVKTLGQPFVCVNCRTASTSGAACQKCSGTKFSRPARVIPTNRLLELSISEDMYKQLVDAAGKVRQIAGQWSTS